MGTSPPSHTNREAAFCLSYYGGLVLESSPREWSCLPSTFPRGAPQPLSTWLLDQVLEESLGLGLCVCVHVRIGGNSQARAGTAVLPFPSLLLCGCLPAKQRARLPPHGQGDRAAFPRSTAVLLSGPSLICLPRNWKLLPSFRAVSSPGVCQERSGSGAAHRAWWFEAPVPEDGRLLPGRDRNVNFSAFSHFK